MKAPLKQQPQSITQPKTSSTTKIEDQKAGFVFAKQNYTFMLIGIGIIVLGYLLMIGGGSDDPNVFNEEIFSFRRITLAPILIIGGLVLEVFAIMWKFEKE